MEKCIYTQVKHSVQLMKTVTEATTAEKIVWNCFKYKIKNIDTLNDIWGW